MTYFNKHSSMFDTLLYLISRIIFIVILLADYYYINKSDIPLHKVYGLLGACIASLFMAIYQYRIKWLRGTLIMVISTIITASLLIRVSFLYYENKNKNKNI